MHTGTLQIGEIARQQDLFLKTFNEGLLIINGGFKKAFDDPEDCPVDDYRDRENTAPVSEPDPCPRY